jgi:hypothetical protein
LTPSTGAEAGLANHRQPAIRRGVARACPTEQRPVTHQEVFATLYTNIGLNLSQVRIFDPNGRPQYHH